MKKFKLYLDDVRTPYDPEWIVVRSYNQLVKEIENKGGLENISEISLDHDLDDTAMQEYYLNTMINGSLNYENIREKTGFDCAKYLVDYCLDNDVELPFVSVHSHNPVGSENIIFYINNYLVSCDKEPTCQRIFHKFFVEKVDKEE